MNWLNNILNALHRAVTLPKSSNSLSDLLGSDLAKMWTATLHTLLSQALVGALTTLASSAVSDVGRIQDFLTTTVTHTLAEVSPAIATQINSAIGGEIAGLETIALSDVAPLTTKLLGAIGKVIKSV